MTPAWRALADEARRWSDTGKALEFWWRDDDARRPDPALSRLLALAERSGIPLTLAVIPQGADAALLSDLAPVVSVVQHGTDHVNRAPAGGKKSEFPPQENVAALTARIDSGRRMLLEACGARFVPALVPPWNRLARDRHAAVAAAGLRGLSQYGPRPGASPFPGLRQVNTHVDIIDWQGGRRFVGEDRALEAAVRHLLARRTGLADAEEPTGWLTHHACHDAAAWNYLERLFEMCSALPGVRWRNAQELFHAT
jgi:hypothetical protein